MTYQVLARKWRPKSFATMVGQEHVLQALINALDQQRLHHAYLFTGTRGVGKTTIARILAKCLNCEIGISSKPCGSCSACVAIDAGRFIDLIEVDAASRTKVEDTRELLENVQYAPANGRFKVYLIDEVHMLSGHSFNALLKTLEEPPPHVKFLLATTDPHKLPITVLSRCLQFNLKNLLPELISKHLATVLTAEKISFEMEALTQLAQAADGSMRDALSLLDQAIAFGNGIVKTKDVHSMLGTIEDNHVLNILTALADHNAPELLHITAKLAEHAVDFQQALEALLSYLHKLAVLQAIQQTSADPLAEKLSKADIQLFYQIALIGRRDLPLAPSQKIGFEMVLLRMLDFRPNTAVPRPLPSSESPLRPEHISTRPEKPSSSLEQPKTVSGKNFSEHIENTSTVTTSSAKQSIPDVGNFETIINNQCSSEMSSIKWAELIDKLSLTGMALVLANNCELKEINESKITLILATQHAPLLNLLHQQRIEKALQTYFNKSIKLFITISETTEIQSPAKVLQLQQDLQKQKAEASLKSDPAVAQLLESFKATIDNASIHPITEED